MSGGERNKQKILYTGDLQRNYSDVLKLHFQNFSPKLAGMLSRG